MTRSAELLAELNSLAKKRGVAAAGHAARVHGVKDNGFTFSWYCGACSETRCASCTNFSVQFTTSPVN